MHHIKPVVKLFDTLSSCSPAHRACGHKRDSCSPCWRLLGVLSPEWMLRHCDCCCAENDCQYMHHQFLGATYKCTHMSCSKIQRTGYPMRTHCLWRACLFTQVVWSRTVVRDCPPWLAFWLQTSEPIDISLQWVTGSLDTMECVAYDCLSKLAISIEGCVPHGQSFPRCETQSDSESDSRTCVFCEMACTFSHNIQTLYSLNAQSCSTSTWFDCTQWLIMCLRKEGQDTRHVEVNWRKWESHASYPGVTLQVQTYKDIWSGQMSA